MDSETVVHKLALGIVYLTVVIPILMLCWDYVMPSIFGLPKITLVQALCLFVVFRTLTSGTIFPFLGK